MEPADRLTYLNGISQEAQTFAERLKALLANTWEALGPRGWLVVLPLLAGALVGILLVWLIAKIVIALAYSIVGTALILLGAQATLLAAGVPVVSDLASRRWLPAVTFATMTVAGWVWQLFFAGAKQPREESDRQTDTPD
jgi:F0F1-type ATP synthase assembly protein I